MIKRLVDAASRHRWPIAVLALVLLVVPFAIASPEGQGSRALGVVLAVGAVVLVFLVAVNLSGRDPDADERARTIAPDPLSAALFARWMQRSKHFRFVGGLSGAVLGAAFAEGSLEPMLVGLVAGVALGGAAAELHSIGRRARPARSADLGVRRVRDYVPRTDALAMVAVALVAICLAVAAVVDRTDRRPSFGPAVAALVAVAAAAAMQQAVVLRRRPALSPELRRADDLMRRLAATQGFTRPAIAFALLMVSEGLDTFGSSVGAVAAVPVLWALAIAWYVASRQSRANMEALVGS